MIGPHVLGTKRRPGQQEGKGKRRRITGVDIRERKKDYSGVCAKNGL